jgi:hypothetical protein
VESREAGQSLGVDDIFMRAALLAAIWAPLGFSMDAVLETWKNGDRNRLGEKASHDRDSVQHRLYLSSFFRMAFRGLVSSVCVGGTLKLRQNIVLRSCILIVSGF